MINFYVTLAPLEPYFFGSERKFKDGISKAQSTYFIQSEFMPQQVTLLGMIRFFLLKQLGYVRDDYQIDERLIGKNSFIIPDNIFQKVSNNKSLEMSCNYKQNFGVIKSMSPLFLADQDERYYIITPKNHQKGKPVYTPYEMIKMDADGRCDSYLLKDYSGKTGITDSYTRLSDGRIFEVDELFGKTENIGIYKKADEEGFYKKEYKYLKTKKGIFQFAFFLSLADDSEIFNHKLSHFLQKGYMAKDIVYMGLGKSTFSIKIERKENDFYSQVANLMKKNCTQELITYYTASDTLFLEQPKVSFAIIETGNFRYLMTQRSSKDYWSRMKASRLYQVVKPGSIFWVKKDKEEEFEREFHIINCKKIGMNQLIGSDNYESRVNEDKMSN